MLGLVKPWASLVFLWQLILKPQIIFDVGARGGSRNFRGLLPVSSLSFPLTPPTLRRSSHQHEAGPRSLGVAWTRQEQLSVQPHFLIPTALVPLISLSPRPGSAVSSSVFLGKVRPYCLLPEWPEYSESSISS